MSGVQDNIRDPDFQPSLSLLLMIVSAAAEAVIVTDPRQPDNPIVFASGAMEKMTGYSQADVVGKNCRFLQGAETDPDTVAQIRRAVAEGLPFEGEILNYRRDGQEFWNSLRIRPVHDEENLPIFFIGRLSDITEMKRSQQLSMNSEHHLRSILEAIPHLVVVIDSAGLLRQIFTGNADLLPELAEHLIGRSIAEMTEFLAPDVISQIHQVIDETLATGAMQHFECPVDYPQTGERRWFRARAVPYGTPVDRCVMFAAREITKQKNDEELLRIADRRLEEAQRMGRTGSWEWNIGTGQMWWSAHLYQLCGLESDSFKPYSDAILDLVVPEDRSVVQEHMAVARAPGASLDAEYRIRRRDGGLILIAAHVELVDSVTLHPSRMFGTVQDISEQRLGELEIRRVEELASLGTMAAGIAHEINNPMSAASAAVDAAFHARENPQAAEIVNECLRTIASSVQRCQSIIQNVLKLARQQGSEKTSCDANKIVQAAHESTQYYANQRGAAVELELADLHSSVLVNAAEIEQVVVNMIRNAVQSGAQQIKISTLEVEGQLQICIRDNGAGIPADNLDKIFDPYFTHGGSSENTGLGLSISQTIVHEHNGNIHVKSALGEGTTVVVKLPLTPAP